MPTLAINPSGRPSGWAMHNEGIANGLAVPAHLMRRASRCVAPQKTSKSLRKAGLSAPENKRVFRSGKSLILGCPCLFFLRGFRSIRPQILSPEVVPFKGVRSVGESLRQIHRRMPDKELTPQIEQEIVEAVQAVQAYRAERRG